MISTYSGSGAVITEEMHVTRSSVAENFMTTSASDCAYRRFRREKRSGIRRERNGESTSSNEELPPPMPFYTASLCGHQRDARRNSNDGHLSPDNLSFAVW